MLPIFSVLADVVLCGRTSRNSEKDALKVVRTKITDTGGPPAYPSLLLTHGLQC